ncbi:MAG: hypothetical protein ACXIUZ_01870 [Lysobacteraceae bacterium]
MLNVAANVWMEAQLDRHDLMLVEKAQRVLRGVCDLTRGGALAWLRLARRKAVRERTKAIFDGVINDLHLEEREARELLEADGPGTFVAFDDHFA